MKGSRRSDDSDRTVPLAETKPDGDLYCLLVLREGAGAVHVLPHRGEIVVGRSSDADVTVDDRSISRRHARVMLGPPWRIEDLGSANGTRVRGRKVPPATVETFDVGEMLQLGAVSLVVQPAAQCLPSSSTRVGERRDLTPTGLFDRFRLERGEVIVVDRAMRQIFQLAERVAASDITVLLLGETGVGKDVVAEALHRMSPRASKPFLRLNCAGLNDALLESELFGYERGAFTGAVTAKPGLLEAANGGTVFLDEVGELSSTVQAKLLRVLEDRRTLRVGALRPVDIDVRFVCATHRDLAERVREGQFRQDLFYRINGVSMTLPPLRDRPDEIEPLARHFALGAQRASGVPAPTLTAAALSVLRRHDWPGNVRELRNAIERAAWLSATGVIDVPSLPDTVRGGTVASVVSSRPTSQRFDDTSPQQSAPDSRERASGPTAASRAGRPSRSGRQLRGEMADLERTRIVEALEQCAGNQTRAAELLGMPRRTLVARLSEYGIRRPRKA